MNNYKESMNIIAKINKLTYNPQKFGKLLWDMGVLGRLNSLGNWETLQQIPYTNNYKEFTRCHVQIPLATISTRLAP